MVTESLKARLLHHLMALREEVLHDVYLDMHKSYDALEHGRCLDILVAYGVGPLALRHPWSYWYRLEIVPREGG